MGEDGCALTDVDSSKLTIRDTTGPAIALPPPLELECSEPGGVPGDHTEVVNWLAAGIRIRRL